MCLEAIRLEDWVRVTANLLRLSGIADPLRDARLLAAAGCGRTVGQILAEPDHLLTSGDLARLDRFRQRRAAREPVSRILGRRGFMDLELEISPDTLDPRADTETLVEAVVEILTAEGRHSAPLVIADLGTGSGAILIALLRALPGARGLGIDISQAALDVAVRNAVSAGVQDRAAWSCGDWLDGVLATFDVIASNPPYLPSEEIKALDPEVALHDPRLALDGGADGLDAYRAIAAQADRRLNRRGWLFLEAGAGQAADLMGLVDPVGMARAAGAVRTFRDLAGHVRCVAKQHHISEER